MAKKTYRGCGPMEVREQKVSKRLFYACPTCGREITITAPQNAPRTYVPHESPVPKYETYGDWWKRMRGG